MIIVMMFVIMSNHNWHDHCPQAVMASLSDGSPWRGDGEGESRERLSGGSLREKNTF